MAAPGKDGEIEKPEASPWGRNGLSCVARGGAGVQRALKKLQAVLFNVLLFQFHPHYIFACPPPQQPEEEFISSRH